MAQDLCAERGGGSRKSSRAPASMAGGERRGAKISLATIALLALVTLISARARRPSTAGKDVIARFAAIVGADHCIWKPEQLRTYECDALTSFRVCPGLVVLPRTTEEV